MNEQEIRKGIESGKQHPFALLQHLAREGDEQGARIVAEVGPEYVQGKDRLRFRSLVWELVPGVFEAEESRVAARSERKRQEQTSALGDSLAAMNAAERERRERRAPSSGGGWNLPMSV